MSAHVIYGMQVSLDGFVEAPGAAIDWTMPDAELHGFLNDQSRSAAGELYGRRLWELMSGYWPTADEEPGASPEVVDFARIWRATPKVVFSRTLERVEGNARLVRGDAAEEVARLKRDGDGELHTGGAALGGSLLRAGLVDELRLYVYPIVLGAGTPFLPPLDRRLPLEPIETRRFGMGVTYLSYRVANA
ncbi:dihydrofolate reductase family protein [Conexibacter sp. CPCC 206217]|uniref:dihydrofolate reductase family protein n=1 Tax=Conexibacter sp. CPCC 206217 TaxID=3064574 RepID=UPI002721403B|nr:dihydrofolate reductase family protein [Conexibacter sp. CPCC 206217]MDO8210622.1 dihydrofolate reductase family protein [Conexibacter sp. CPCC 206217]